MKDPLISVLFPVYNTKEEYLKASIESILSQTYTNFELIVIDNNSTESHVQSVIASYDDPRIRYMCLRGSLSDILNQGIDCAQGEYIARMDSDDISYPQRFEKQLQYFMDNPDVSLLGTYYKIKDVESSTDYLEENVSLFSFFVGSPLAHPTVMWKKRDFQRYNLYYDSNCLHYEDYDLWFRAIQVLKVRNVPEVLLDYRIHPDSISVQNRALQEESVVKTQRKILEFCTSGKEEHMLLQSTIVSIYSEIRGLLRSPYKKKWFGRVTYRGGSYVRYYFFRIPIITRRLRR